MLRLELAIEPPSASGGVAIVARVALVNAADRPLIVNARLGWNAPDAARDVRDLTFLIDGPPQRRAIAVDVRRGNPRAEDFMMLPHGESTRTELELTRYHVLDAPGAYAIKALYTNVHRGPGPDAAWTGELESNTEHFVRNA